MQLCNLLCYLKSCFRPGGAGGSGDVAGGDMESRRGGAWCPGWGEVSFRNPFIIDFRFFFEGLLSQAMAVAFLFPILRGQPTIHPFRFSQSHNP